MSIEEKLKSLKTRYRFDGEKLHLQFEPRFRTQRLSGFLWFGIETYLEDPLFFFRQVYCFFFGHKMEFEELGADSIHGVCARYTCKDCGQGMYLGIKDSDQVLIARLPAHIEVLSEIVGDEE